MNDIKISNDMVPIGTVLPFPEGKVPSGWLAFDGTYYGRYQHPSIWDKLHESPGALTVWKTFGGKFDSKSFTMPKMDSDESKIAVFNAVIDTMPDIELAIKAIR